ncbi:hypothetical protein ACLKA6_007644 [Drosophila palustris]
MEIRAINFVDETEETDAIEPTESTTTTTQKRPRPGPTPPKSTTVSPVTETKAISTPKNEEGATTPISETVTTPSDQSDIVCVNAAKETISILTMVFSAQISFVQPDESVLYVIVSQAKYDSWNMIYFSHNSSVSYVDSENIEVGSMGDTTITVRDLICNTSYVFCLLQGSETSPFNCQSHHTVMCETTNSSWFEDHSVLIISLAIGGILLFVILGGLAVFAILWQRPSWLWGSKRLQRTSRDSLTMLLLPPSYQKESYGVIRSKNGNDAIGDYVVYYRHLEQAKLYHTEYNKYNIPPQESAPPAPTNSHTYECFDLYEELP